MERNAMDNTEDIELHDLETIERHLSGDGASERDPREGDAVLLASGLMSLSASGFMMP
jgi:hypothetical protein